MALGGRLNGWSVWISSAVLSSIRLWLLGLSWVIVLDLSLLSLPSVFFLSFSSVALLLSLLVIKCLLASVLVLYSDVLVLSCSVPTLLTLEGDQWFALKLFLFFTSWCAWVRLHTWIYSHANVGRSRCNCTSMDSIHALTYIYIYICIYITYVFVRVCVSVRIYVYACTHTTNRTVMNYPLYIGAGAVLCLGNNLNVSVNGCPAFEVNAQDIAQVTTPSKNDLAIELVQDDTR